MEVYMNNIMNYKDVQNIEVLINNGYNSAGMNERIANMNSAVQMKKSNKSKVIKLMAMLIR